MQRTNVYNYIIVDPTEIYWLVVCVFVRFENECACARSTH